MLEKIVNILEKLYKLVTIPLLILMCITTFTQVVARYVFSCPFSWTDELARYTFIWLTFLGAGLVYRRREMMKITFFLQFLSPKVKMLIDKFNLILIFFFTLALLKEGLILAFESDYPSIALKLPFTYIYLSIPVGAVFMLIITIHHFQTDKIKNNLNEVIDKQERV